MPTTDPQLRLALPEVREVVQRACFPPGDGRTGIGLEIELLPVYRDRQGRPAGRVPLRSLLAILAAAAGDTLDARGVPADAPVTFTLPSGGRLTFEPGGQLEISGAYHDTLAGAVDEVERAAAALAGVLERADIALAGVGADPWHDVRDVGQQLTAARYPAMARYLAQRGAAGATMMRHTCALQVNLDRGDGEIADERWVVANLLAPLLVASFAASPALAPARTVSQRAAVWAQVDPTRTGFPPGIAGDGPPDAVDQLVAAALRADVLLVRQGAERAIPGRPGWPFEDWLAHGHPEHGWPTVSDLQEHLTTLFHEVRPRGSLEIRSIDALPARWRAVPATLLAGGLYDDRARGQLLALLAPRRHLLPALHRRAAEVGVSDPGLCALAVEAWSLALAGARRLPAGFLPPRAVATVEAFVDRYTVRGRTPADELRALGAVGSAAALAWAAEPLPTATREAR